jgi:predicted dehydrogenase
VVVKDPLRIVIAGAGAQVLAFHEPGIAAIGAQVVGVHDVRSEAVEPVAARYRCPAVEDLGALLEIAADVAVVLAPHPFHAAIVTACLDAGLHVLTEKPLAVTPTEADAMIAAAERAGRLLAVAFQQRTRPEIGEARTFDVGELLHASLYASWPRRIGYFDAAPWRGTWRGEGGGVLLNQGQHDLDLLCLLAGKPAEVVARRLTRIHPIETEDTVSALLTWPGGATGSLHVSTAQFGDVQRIEVIGTHGRVLVRPGELERRRDAVDFREYAAQRGADPFAPPEIARAWTARDGDAGSHAALYRNLVAAIAGREPLIAGGASAREPLELAAALIMSSLTGTPVSLPVDRAAYDELLADRIRESAPRGR